MYRNHLYIEKLLGNLIGLGRLMEFVAHEAGLKVGALTVISTHAEIDQPRRYGKPTSRSEIAAMIAKFDQAAAPLGGVSAGEGKLERVWVGIVGRETVNLIDAGDELGLAAITWMADDLDFVSRPFSAMPASRPIATIRRGFNIAIRAVSNGHAASRSALVWHRFEK